MQTLNEQATPPSRAWMWIPALLLLHTWLWPYWPLFNAPDENSRLYLTRALVEQRRLDVDHQVARFGASPGLARFDEHDYSDKAIGQSLLAAFAYAPINAIAGDGASQALVLHLVSLLTCAVPTALVTAALAWWLWPKVGAAAHVAAAAYSLASPALPYSAMFYSHQLAAAWLFLAWWLIVRGRLRLASLTLGAAVITEFPVALPAAALGIWALARADGAKQRGIILLAGLPAILIQLGYNWLVFGSPWELAYAHKTDPSEIAWHAQGLWGITLVPHLEAIWGLLLSPSKGLFFYAPATALAVIGAFLRRGGSAEHRPAPQLQDAAGAGPEPMPGRGAILAGAGLLVLGLSSFSSWQGGWSTGPRMLLPVLPLLFLLLGEWGNRLPVLALSLLTGVGMAHSLLPTLTFPLLPAESADPVAELSMNLLMSGSVTFTLGGFWLSPVTAVVLFICGIVVVLVVTCGPRRTGEILLGASLALALTAARRPEPTSNPKSGWMLADQLYYSGRPGDAAPILAAIRRGYNWPPDAAAALLEREQVCQYGQPPPLQPRLWIGSRQD